MSTPTLTEQIDAIRKAARIGWAQLSGTDLICLRHTQELLWSLTATKTRKPVAKTRGRGAMPRM